MAYDFILCRPRKLGNIHKAIELICLIIIFEVSIIGDWDISAHQNEAGVVRHSRNYRNIFFFCAEIVAQVERGTAFKNIGRGAIHILKWNLYISQPWIEKPGKRCIGAIIGCIKACCIEFTF